MAGHPSSVPSGLRLRTFPIVSRRHDDRSFRARFQLVSKRTERSRCPFTPERTGPLSQSLEMSRAGSTAATRTTDSREELVSVADHHRELGTRNQPSTIVVELAGRVRSHLEIPVPS